MGIKRLHLHDFRNLNEIELSFGPTMNIISGPNGSGKTSILEAIYLLSTGRSFRASVNRHFIAHEQASTTLYAELFSGDSIGLEKNRSAQARIRVNQESLQNMSGLARLLPLQLMEPGSYQLIDDVSVYRRQFLHWGLFHVEPSFYLSWQSYQRALKQRNYGLRHQASLRDLEPWTRECHVHGSALLSQYEAYLSEWIPLFLETLNNLMPELVIQVQLASGWKSDHSLFDAMTEDYQLDREQGYTHHGPHRADLKFSTDQGLVKQSFSRGQKKILLLAMKLSQGKLLFQQNQKQTIYLIDDLAAELDDRHRHQLAETLGTINAQTIITTVNANQLLGFGNGDHKLFHVERGVLCRS